MSSPYPKSHSPKPSLKPKFIQPASNGFFSGVLAGSIFHFSKALYNHSPPGSRIHSSFLSLRNAPRVGCTFATGFILCDISRCAIANYRRNNGVLTQYMAIGAASGILKLRDGGWVAVRWAVSMPILVLGYKLGRFALFPRKGNVGMVESFRSNQERSKSDIRRR